MSSERITYEAANITISSARVVLGSTTYSTANIASVELTVDRGGQYGAIFGAVLLAFVAIVMFGATAVAPRAQRSSDYYFAVIILVIAALLGMVAPRLIRYGVRLRTNAGSTRAYESRSLDVIRPIVTAIEDAIVARG